MINPSEKFLFEHDGKRFFYADVLESLQKLGINTGDKIFVHSDLQAFGKINPNITREEYLDSFIAALCNAVGESGTVIMPTFSYSFSKGKDYNPAESPSTVGILTERFRTLPGVARTLDPIFSAAIWGSNQATFLDVGQTCLGENSIFHKALQNNCLFLFLGKTFDMTFIHYVEQKQQIYYRYIKRFFGKIITHGKVTEAYNDYHVRALNDKNVYAQEKIAEFLKGKNVLHTARLGFSQIRTVTAQDADLHLSSGLKNDHWLLFEGTREEIIAREQHKLLTSNYIPQKTDEMNANSLNAKEARFLSSIDGKRDLLHIAEQMQVPGWELHTLIEKFHKLGVISAQETK